MTRILTQGLILVGIFFISLFLMNQLDWMKLFNVKQATQKTEEKLGELFWEIFKDNGVEVNDTLVIHSIDSIVSVLCKVNNIDRDKIKLHLLVRDDVNAFALPDGHLVIFSGLIQESGNPDELSGVIAHELAHIKLNHVMTKLMREVGLSVLLSMASGGGGDMLKETAKMLSSTAFDRALEKEADIKAVDYLIEANISPEPFATFLFRLSGDTHALQKYIVWVSTHPDSEERAKYIMEKIKGVEITFKPVLTDSQWQEVKSRLAEKPL